MTAFEELTAGGIAVYGGPYHDGDQYVSNRQAPGVGHKVCLRNGAEFVFVRVPTDDISLGAPVCIPTVGTVSYQSTTALQLQDTKEGSETIVIDSSEILAGSTGGIVPAGYFSGGNLVIAAGDAAGTYGIISHTAGTNSTNIVLTLDRPLTGDTSSAEAFLTLYAVNNAGAYDSDNNKVVIGFAASAFTASTNSRVEYGWVQTAGIGGVKIKTVTNIAVGSDLSLGDGAGLILKASAGAPTLAESLVDAAEIAAGDIIPAVIKV